MAEKRSLYELHGQKAGILGFGNITKEVAVRLQPFGMYIIAINRNEVESEDVDWYVSLRSLYEILPEIDVLFICIVFTQETAMLIDRRALGLMKNETVIVNVSRGDIIDEMALKDYMNEGKFMGCGLDVFSEEPIINSRGFSSLGGTKTSYLLTYFIYIGQYWGAAVWNHVAKSIRGSGR